MQPAACVGTGGFCAYLASRRSCSDIHRFHAELWLACWHEGFEKHGFLSRAQRWILSPDQLPALICYVSIEKLLPDYSIALVKFKAKFPIVSCTPA